MFGCVRRILFALSDWDGMLARCRNPLRKRPRTLELDLILKPSSSGLRTFRQHLSSTATTGCRVSSGRNIRTTLHSTAANSAVAPLLAGADGALLRAPVNVLRLTLHPAGLAPRIANLPEWRTHLLERLRRQIELTADSALASLMNELRAYPATNQLQTDKSKQSRDYGGVVVPFELITNAGVLAFFSTTTVFGTPVDITLSELALESFFPADETTFEALRRASGKH
jgi:hypothetical protein